MLATKAFGMGIDIPDIDNVITLLPLEMYAIMSRRLVGAARELKEGRAITFLVTRLCSYK